MTLVLSPLNGSGFPRLSSLSLVCARGAGPNSPSAISGFSGSSGSSGFGGGGSVVIVNKSRSDAVVLAGSLGPKTVHSKYSWAAV